MSSLQDLGLAINDLAEDLPSDYRLPSIGKSHTLVSPEVWGLLADIELLQATFAGSRTWETDADGEALRSEAHLICITLARRAERAGLGQLSVRLTAISELVEPAR